MSKHALRARAITLIPALVAMIHYTPTSASPLASGPGLSIPAVDGAWAEVSTSGTYPGTNSYHVAIYDPDGDQMVVAGGTFAPGLVVGLSLGVSPTWTQLSPAFSGVPTNAPCAIYDPIRKRMVQFGGDNKNDVWTLSLVGTPTWTKLAPTGLLPPGRSFAVAVYDPVRDRMVVFAGFDGNSGLTDAWALTLADPPAWTRLNPVGTAPPSGLGQTGVYDPVNDRMVVYGGYSGALSALNFSGTLQWTPITPEPGSPVPVARAFPAAIYDPVQARMVLFGGYSNGRLNETWAVNFSGPTRWLQLQPTGVPPAPTNVLSAIYQPNVNRMIVYGGIFAAAGAFALSWPSTSGPPSITAIIPAGGKVGDVIDIQGSNLTDAQQVQFNGVSAQVTQNTWTDIFAAVPAGATTGPITVTTAAGSTTSSMSFFVGETPVISVATPPSGKFASVVILSGDHFNGATRVAFGPHSFATYTIDSDQQITATVDSQATTAPISVTTPAATGASAFSFVIVPPDTAPVLVSVRDVPNDQGGRVYLKWAHSDYDNPVNHWITGYRVWRRAPPSAAPHATGPGWIKRVSPDGVTVDYWQALVTLPSAFLPGYSYDAPTTQDSLPGGNPYTAYFIQGLTADPLVFYSSRVDSGYSVDNLAPGAPQSVAASYTPTGVALHWGANPEADLQLYRIYRGGSTGFVPSSANLLVAKPDTGYFDPGGDLTTYYKIAAVDLHGNQGRFALIAPQFATSALASLVSATADPGRVEVVWYSPDPDLAATVYRRTPDSDWISLGSLSAAGDGLISYHDATVTNGGRYGYRLGIWDGGVETFVGEAWVSVPFPTLSLRGVSPNPSVGRSLLVRFDLPSSESANLRLFDVEGRLVRSEAVGALGPGEHSVDLAAGVGLSPGVYLIRLEQGKRAQIVRTVVMR